MKIHYLALFSLLASCGGKIQNPSLKELNPNSSTRVETQSSALTFNINGIEVVNELDPRLKFTFESMIASPIAGPNGYNGVIQATGVSLLSETKMIITYNTKDAIVEGGIDIVDISDLKNPVIIKSFVMPTLEFADSKIVGSKLYLSGVSENNGAALVTIDLSNPTSPTIVDTKILSSYYATSISAKGDTLLVTTGDTNGFVYKYELNSQGIPVEVFKHSYPKNLLYVQHYKNGYVVLFDESDNLTYLGYKDLINNTFTKIKVNNTHLESPARFDIADNTAFVNTADSMTVLAFDLNDMQQVGSVNIAGRANGLKIANDLLYVAQGLEGFALYDVKDLSSFVSLGKFDFKDQGAGNNIWTFFDTNLSKKVVVLSDGLGGVKILSQEKDAVTNSSSCNYATKVISYEPKGSIALNRKDSSKALGKPEGDINPVINFVSLGYEGSLILEMNPPVKNIAGKPDFMVYETTWNNQTFQQYPEEADVYASNSLTCGNWTFLKRVKNHNGNPSLGEVDLGSLSSAKYIKIVDKTDKTKLSGADGFDVDGIKCINQPTQAITGVDYDLLWKDGGSKKIYQLFIDEPNKIISNYSLLESNYVNSHIARSNDGIYLYEFLADGTKMAVINLITKQTIAIPTISQSPNHSITQATVSPDKNWILGDSQDNTMYKLPTYVTGGLISLGQIYLSNNKTLDISGADMAYLGSQLYVATIANGGQIYKVSFNATKNRYEGTLLFKKLGSISGLAVFKDKDGKTKFLVSLLKSHYMKLVYDNKVISLKLQGELQESSKSGDLSNRNM